MSPFQVGWVGGGVVFALIVLACRPEGPVEPTSSVPPWGDPTETTAAILAVGPVVTDEGVQFRVGSMNATAMAVWVYPTAIGSPEALVVPLVPQGDVFVGDVSWDALRDAGVETVFYGVRVWGPNWPLVEDWVPGSDAGFLADVDSAANRFNPNKLLLDPYGRELSHDPGRDWSVFASGDYRADDSALVAPKSVIVAPGQPPRPGPAHAPQDHVIYEVHVRGLTQLDPDVPLALRGTYAGAALRAKDLADLGVTAIELMPVHETVNDANDLSPDDAGGDNYWGYSTLGFFAPDRRYASDPSPGGPTAEFKAMVDAFHAEGISVILDVVYNHTAEGGTWDGAGNTAALLSWRGLDNASYYEVSGTSGYRNDNGVGPNWNAVNPLARQLVIDSLVYWTSEMGVDGFRFDLAPILGNGCETDCFAFDPEDPDGILARARGVVDGLLIAEPWGATGEAYQGGRFPAGWSEWNDAYRDTIRSDQNELGDRHTPLRALLDGFLGGPSRYGDDGRPPWAQVGYVVAHDGFTLRDLYACNEPDNDQGWPYGPSNGGSTDNRSWDQGGSDVAQRRAARTGMALTLLSAGIPMFNGGDELLRSQQCNNNPYNLDSVATWIDWPALTAENSSFRTFTQRLLAFRAAHPALRPSNWRNDGVVVAMDTFGQTAGDAYLDAADTHAVQFWVDGAAQGDPFDAILVLYNGWTAGLEFTLPPTRSGQPWHLVADSHEWLEHEDNALVAGQESPLLSNTYLLGGRSLSLLVDPGFR